MIERINANKYYIFPHLKKLNDLPPIPKDLLKKTKKITYIEFVKSKNIIDILHQINMVALKGKQKELNVYFRAALEAILLHIDNTGEHDCKYEETNK